MPESPRHNMSVLTDKLLGVLLIVGLIIAGLSGLFYAQSLFERRDTAMLRTIPDLLITWREGGALFWPMMLILFAPAILLQSVFGEDRRTMTLFKRRLRQTLTATAVGCVALGVAWGAIAGRDEVAVATPFGVSWLYDGKPREYWTWGAASDVGVGCVTQRDDKTSAPTYVLNYDVTAPSGREARLVRDETETPKDVSRLLARLAPIDQSLRARAVPRFATTDEACMSHYSKGLTQAEQATLRTLFSR